MCLCPDVSLVNKLAALFLRNSGKHVPYTIGGLKHRCTKGFRHGIWFTDMYHTYTIGSMKGREMSGTEVLGISIMAGTCHLS